MCCPQHPKIHILIRTQSFTNSSYTIRCAFYECRRIITHILICWSADDIEGVCAGTLLFGWANQGEWKRVIELASTKLCSDDQSVNTAHSNQTHTFIQDHTPNAPVYGEHISVYNKNDLLKGAKISIQNGEAATNGFVSRSRAENAGRTMPANEYQKCTCLILTILWPPFAK